jgi:CRISPR/Cas system Type II protein with McrA/HNH and RuvC-like nuclease domain
MSKILGLDLGTNSIGWALVDTSANKIISRGVRIFPEASQRHQHNRRRFLRVVRRYNQRFAAKFLYLLRNYFTHLFYQPSLIDKVKNLAPVFIHSLLAILFAGSLLMAALNQKDFQFWFNLAITVLLAWIALKK